VTNVTAIHNIVYRWLFGLGTLNIQIAIIQQTTPGETAAQIKPQPCCLNWASEKQIMPEKRERQTPEKTN